MNLRHFTDVQSNRWRSIGAACSAIAACASLFGCLGTAVRPTDGDASADNDVAAPPRADASAADGSTPTGACLPTAAPTCGDSLPEARMLYEFRAAIPAQPPSGTPAPGCYLATSLVALGGAFGYGPTSMRVVSTGATTGVLQLQSAREAGMAPFRMDFGYNSSNASALLDVRCPLAGFSSGRHRYAVRPDGAIELHWLENDRVTGYMVFERCAPTASGGCS
jgi:hypothetical protein